MTCRKHSTTIASTTAIAKETTVTTNTENAADLGFPAPSSFPTLTLAAALNPIETMNTSPFTDMHTESESKASSGFSSNPAMRTRT
nr:hypothetical protein Iba_chr04eCG5080 [Ipomoea batatas]GMD85317.1 hypothetical protein Iba_scaffold1592103CG0010 [Ipomoea batatas]